MKAWPFESDGLNGKDIRLVFLSDKSVKIMLMIIACLSVNPIHHIHGKQLQKESVKGQCFHLF